jgi:hypothetical protein
MKALQRLDPTGATLAAVAPPLRAYLRRRRDAVKSIVTALLDDDESDLRADLLNSTRFASLQTDGETEPNVANLWLGKLEPVGAKMSEDADVWVPKQSLVGPGGGGGGLDSALPSLALIFFYFLAPTALRREVPLDIIQTLVDVFGST